MALGGGGNRQHHRHARADEQKGQKRGERNAERRLARMAPHFRAAAEDAVGKQQAAKRKRIRQQEDPHSDLAQAGTSKILVRGQGVGNGGTASCGSRDCAHSWVSFARLCRAGVAWALRSGKSFCSQRWRISVRVLTRAAAFHYQRSE